MRNDREPDGVELQPEAVSNDLWDLSQQQRNLLPQEGLGYARLLEGAAMDKPVVSSLSGVGSRPGTSIWH